MFPKYSKLPKRIEIITLVSKKKDDGIYMIGGTRHRETRGMGNTFKLKTASSLVEGLTYPKDSPGCASKETYTGSWVVHLSPDAAA